MVNQILLQLLHLTWQQYTYCNCILCKNQLKSEVKCIFAENIKIKNNALFVGLKKNH